MIDLELSEIFDRLNVSREEKVMKLRWGLEDLAEDYDFIIIDGTPSLNLSTVNVLSACDMVFVPTPAAMPDYASTLKFVGLLQDTVSGYLAIEDNDDDDDKFEVNLPDMRFFITKYSSNSYAQFMGKVIRKVFTVDEGDVLKNESYHSEEVGKAGNKISSIYEINPSEADNRARLKKTKEAYDKLFTEMHDIIWETCLESDPSEDKLGTNNLDEIIANANTVDKEALAMENK